MMVTSRTIRNCSGFSLIELMITLLIALILMIIAAPLLNSTIKNNRLTTQLNRVIIDIHFARSEAIKRSIHVIMCRSADPDAINPSCGGTEQTWTDGYLVFADDGSNANNIYDAGTDILLRRGQAANSEIMMHTNLTWNNNLKFTFLGTIDGDGSTAVMSICDDRGIKYGKQIKVRPTGIPKTYSTATLSCDP